MSSITFTPLCEIVAHPAHVRDHRSFLALDFLAKLASAQAPRRCSYQLAAKTFTASNRRAVALTMPNRIREISARRPPAPPLTINPVNRITG